MKIFAFLFLMLGSTAYSYQAKFEIERTLQHVKAYIDTKIETAQVETYPFPHIVIEGIFPENLYQKMQTNWPSSQEFVGTSRAILPVTGGCLEDTSLPTNQKIFWRIFGEVIVNKYIKPQLIAKLAPFINMKYRLENFEVSKLNYFLDFANLRQDGLVQDQSRYSISPHIDQLNIFAALLFYLPADNDHQDFGTLFFEGPYSQNPNEIYKGHDLKFVKKIPYKSNTLVCFLQSPLSWHSVEPSNYNNYIRKIYIAPIFLSPEFVATHYQGIYKRSIADEYFFDHRFLSRNNWQNIWSEQDYYQQFE